MSLQLDIQQKVMDIFVDQVADAELGTIPTFNEYLNPTQDTETSRVHSFDPSVAVVEGSFGQRLGTLTFTLQYKRAVGDSDFNNVGNVVERFATALRLDPTLGGLVLQCSVSTRGTEVRNEVSESILATMTITATIDDGDISQPGVVSKKDLIDLDGNAANITTSANATMADSTLFPGAVTMSNTGGTAPFFQFTKADFPEMPSDVSPGTGLRVWRFLVYAHPSIDTILATLNITFLSTVGNNVQVGSTLVTIGWNEFVLDIDNPGASGGAFDDTNLTTITFQLFTTTAAFTDAFTVKRIFQYPRDRGSSGFSSGF